ncbi:hypothetical protein pdam_00014855, partial [Pocillopora damicornis]
PPDAPTGIYSPFESLIGKLISENVVYFATGDLSDRKIALNWMSNGDKTVTYRNFRKFDGQSFRNDILSQSWENVYGFSIPNLCAFLALANRSAPLRTKRVRLRNSA